MMVPKLKNIFGLYGLYTSFSALYSNHDAWVSFQASVAGLMQPSFAFFLINLDFPVSSLQSTTWLRVGDKVAVIDAYQFLTATETVRYLNNYLTN